MVVQPRVGAVFRPVYRSASSTAAGPTLRSLTRPGLSGRSEAGPLVIEEYDSTTVVPHRTWTATVDDASNIILQRN